MQLEPAKTVWIVGGNPREGRGPAGHHQKVRPELGFCGGMLPMSAYRPLPWEWSLELGMPGVME